MRRIANLDRLMDLSRALLFAKLAQSAFIVASLLLCSPQGAEAQESHWGVTASLVPTWSRIPELYEYIWDTDELRPDGTKEFRIGVVRGSDRGGDWSVAFVRNWFRTDQVFDDTFPLITLSDQEGNIQELGLAGSVFTIPGTVEYVGVKFEKFTPFVTIKDRVQVGLTYGGGIGSLSGTVVEQRFEGDVDFPPPNFDPVITNETETFIASEAKDFYTPSFVPIGSVEAAVAFILAPGLKARVTGGFSYPNTQVFSITVNYLFGS